MWSKFLTTIRHFIIYSIPNIFNKFVGFLLLPLLTSYLGPKDYGIWTIFEITITILSQILTFGQAPAYVRYFFITNSNGVRKEYFTTIFFTLLIINGTFLVATLGLSSNIASMFVQPALFEQLIQMAGVIIFFRVLITFLLSDLRAKERPSLFAAIVITQAIILLILIVVFLKYFNLGLIGVMYSHLVSNFVASILLLLLTFKNFTQKLNWSLFKETFQYGMPIVFSTMGWMLLNMGDRYVLKYLTNYAQTGLYSYSYKIGQLPFFLIVQPFLSAYMPQAFKWYQNNENRKIYAIVFFYLVTVLSVISFFIATWADVFVKLFTTQNRFWEVYPSVVIIVYGYMWVAAVMLINIAFNITKKTANIASFTLSTALLNIVLNFVFIPLWGYIGAAIATVLSFVVQFGMTYIAAQKTLYIPYKILNYLKINLFWFFLISLNFILINNFPQHDVLIRILIMFLFLGLLFNFRLIKLQDVKNIYYMAKNIIFSLSQKY